MFTFGLCTLEKPEFRGSPGLRVRLVQQSTIINVCHGRHFLKHSLISYIIDTYDINQSLFISTECSFLH